MSIKSVSELRGIKHILHFTTNSGCLGVLASGALKSRQRLRDDEQLKHIFQPNSISRTKDAAWLDYVNLSLTRINQNFFEICSGNWHRESKFWWCILDFSEEILTHNGVFFATTNNIYTGVRRAAGLPGLDALFADEITRWSGNVIARSSGVQASVTTCEQAEVLYPGEVSTTYLRAIHVENIETSDEVAAQISTVNHEPVDILVSPHLFRGEHA